MNYTYDVWNRLVQAGSMTFAYDGFGNLTQQGQTYLSIDQTTNRISSAGYQYNANGNVTQTPGPTSYSYDVANRLVSNGAIYNPGNQRVFDGTYIYLYTPEGKVVGKYQPVWGAYTSSYAFIQGVQPNVYFAGRLIQEQGQWVMTDRLGSVRLHATNGRSNYQPYGAEVAPASDQRTKFATYYRDSAGLDYAGQRYYSNVTGRFLTPDPGGMADASDPGSWNRYAYVGGDPINFADPNGTEREGPDEGLCDTNPMDPACTGRGAARGQPNQIPCNISASDLLRFMQTKGAWAQDGSVNVTGQEPMATAALVNEIMSAASAADVDPRLMIAVAFVEGKWGSEPAATKTDDSFGLMPGGKLQTFSTWGQSITAAAATLSNHINNFDQSTTADLYSGKTTKQNIADGNDPLAAYCVGSGCANKVDTLNKILGKLGGSQDSLTDPCIKGSDGNYYMRQNP